MPRARQPDLENAGQDSFLDVITNIVGIVIILVMVAGMRVKNAPVCAAAPSKATQQAAADLEKDLAAEQSLRRDVLQASQQIEDVQREAIRRYDARNALAVEASAWQQKIESERSRLDADARREFDFRGDLDRARSDLERLGRERASAEMSRSAPITVESYPTPLSRSVDGPEAHFQIHAGHVTFIPMDALLDEFRADASQKAHRLQSQRELTETIGPIGGFRLRYTLRRYDVPTEIQLQTGRGGAYARLKRWTLIPVSQQMGETLQEALSEGSDFRQALARFHPGRTTVTLWTYTDSFAEFRQLRKVLYETGFSVAARPLPEGFPIGGSPEGSKSSAE